MSEGANKLQYSLKTLRERWEEAKEAWRDKVQEDFETNHLIPLERQLSVTVRGMNDLADVMAKMRRECS